MELDRIRSTRALTRARRGGQWLPALAKATGRQDAARLALQLELCLPRLLSSPVPGGSIDGLRAFSRNPGRRARHRSLLPDLVCRGGSRAEQDPTPADD
jgi:hypothetical protein